MIRAVLTEQRKQRPVCKGIQHSGHLFCCPSMLPEMKQSSREVWWEMSSRKVGSCVCTFPPQPALGDCAVLWDIPLLLYCGTLICSSLWKTCCGKVHLLLCSCCLPSVNPCLLFPVEEQLHVGATFQGGSRGTATGLVPGLVHWTRAMVRAMARGVWDNFQEKLRNE